MAKNRNYEEYLYEKLQNPEYAELYLKEALKDEEPGVFLQAVKDVVNAQDFKMKDLAERADLNYQNLYRMLSPKGNPQLTSIKPVLAALGFNLTIESIKK